MIGCMHLVPHTRGMQRERYLTGALRKRYDPLMPPDGPMPPQGRMIVSAVLALFFGAFAAGSLHSAKQDYRWRNAAVVRGVMVRHGDDYHYEYRPPGKPVVAGQSLGDQGSSKPDGVVDDWARLEYDPSLPEHLRPHRSKEGVTQAIQATMKDYAGTMKKLA